jgi:molecular chaperone IbpA
MNDIIPSRFKPVSVGFDDIFDTFSRFTTNELTSYPPHNIIKKSDQDWIIELAVAGFQKDEISIDVSQQNRKLLISGDSLKDNHSPEEYVHRGIGKRAFEKFFTIGPDVEVKDATMEDGILQVHLHKEIPEKHKPKKIPIR